MGYMKHHALMVTSWHDASIIAAHERATQIAKNLSEAHFDCDVTACVSAIYEAPVNQFKSFCIFTDGSKEGWEHSDVGDELRATLIAWLETMRYDDGSTNLNYVEVSYAEEEYRPAQIVSDSNPKGRYNELKSSV